jgi:SAM-dependent methyltransferase
MSEKPLFAYDKVLYPNYVHPQTHPDRLATMTKFFGVEPKPVENCRVLELGCGTGSSLLSFGFDLPGSEFIGFDLSEKQIELGKRAVEEIGIKNVSLRQGDILEINRENLGEFDYIIAHGLYSWVPDAVRDQILKICGEMLAPQGVAFISYNAYPGCHYRRMVRDMMNFHTKNLTSPREKVGQSLGLIEFITDAAGYEKVHHAVLEDEFKNLTERNFENIYHDDLSDFNHPVYFHEFAAHAEKHDLQFVTEVEYFNAKINSKEVLEVLEKISGGNIIVFEQYLDFIKGRRFRQSLLCRKEVSISTRPDPEVLRRIRIASPVHPVSEKPELATGKHEHFAGEKTEKIEIDHPLTKAALFHLGQIWARSISFDELVSASQRLLAEESGANFEITKKDTDILTEVLFHVFCSGLLRLHVHEPVYTTTVSEKPLASPIARWQAEHSDLITTLLCTAIAVQDDIGRELVKLLDGTRDRRQLIADLTDFINSEKFDQPDEIKQKLIRDLPAHLEDNLAAFAEMALLLA